MYDFLRQQLTEQFTVTAVYKETEEKRVVRVRHKTSGEEFLVRELSGDRGSAECYRRLLGLSHPNLPQILEVAEGEEKTLVLEEFIRGDRVSEMLAATCFSPREAQRIGLDLCQALLALHERKVIHRDIKPENILLREKHAVLIDLDAARYQKEENRSDTRMLGTVGYAAPEQFGITRSDARTDIYALGVTLNQLLTGRHPSDQLAEGRFGRIISRCTMVQPDSRYPDVRHLMEALT